MNNKNLNWELIHEYTSNLGLKGLEILVYDYLVKHKHNDSDVICSYHEVAKELNVCTKVAQIIVARLIDNKIIKKYTYFDANNVPYNKYVILKEID